VAIGLRTNAGADRSHGLEDLPALLATSETKARDPLLMELRDYQIRGLDNARAAFRNGAKAVCMVAPTGSGKTVILAAAALGHPGRTVILVHRTELIHQTIDKLERTGVPSIGAIAASRSFNTSAKVVVCSIQTLTARELRPEASLLILDECHHFLASEWNTVAAHYAGVPVVGFTATPMRPDGTALGNLFDALVVVASSRELTAAGHLVPCEVFGPSRRLAHGAMLDPFSLYEAHGEGLPFVLFAGDRAHGRDLAQRFGVPYIDAETVDRSSILQRLERGDFPGVVNVYVLTEGWDCPPVAVCILARGASSPATFIQMVGRIRRPYPGKTVSRLLDCTGAVHLHGLPDSDREYSLTGLPIKVKGELALRTCPVCAAVFEALPACPRCGHVFEPDEPRQIVTGKASRIDSVTPESRKRAFLAAYLEKAQALGRKPGWAMHVFRARFGHWPPPQWMHK